MLRFFLHIFNSLSSRRTWLHGISAAWALTALLLCGCDEKEAPDLPTDKTSGKDCAVLLYAVASNNLASSLFSDLSEIKTAASEIDLKANSFYVYFLTNKETPALYKLTRDHDGSADFTYTQIKDYDRSRFSTDPRRIAEVIGEFKSLSDKAATHGIIFWSHGTGWTPDFSTHEPSADSDSGVTSNQKRSFGWDQLSDDIDHCDIIELADAIPADLFDFIWFDCCYMSGIELAYQLRDKTRWLVAYPTEVWSDGMPYDLTLPMILRRKPDLTGAAEAFASYYLDKEMAVTIGVCDLDKIEKVAELAEKCVKGVRPPRYSFHNFGRSGIGPFFDFGDYTRQWGAGYDGEWSVADFDAALDCLVVYKAASAKDFSGKNIDPEKFSGLTVHYFDDLWDDPSNYYMQLDWFKRVYTTIPDF